MFFQGYAQLFGAYWVCWGHRELLGTKPGWLLCKASTLPVLYSVFCPSRVSLTTTHGNGEELYSEWSRKGKLVINAGASFYKGNLSRNHC